MSTPAPGAAAATRPSPCSGPCSPASRSPSTGSTSTSRTRVIRPAPDPAVPLLVGGRSDAAVRRAGRLGDGWLATWCSVRRLQRGARALRRPGGRAGRDGVALAPHAAAVGRVSTARARRRGARVAAGMEAFYKVPFEAFERYTPYGTPEDVAAFLAPYREAGVERFNLTPMRRLRSRGGGDERRGQAAAGPVGRARRRSGLSCRGAGGRRHRHRSAGPARSLQPAAAAVGGHRRGGRGGGDHPGGGAGEPRRRQAHRRRSRAAAEGRDRHRGGGRQGRGRRPLEAGPAARPGPG